MDILLCPNNYYTFPTLVLMQSLFDNCPPPLHFYVIHSELTDRNIGLLRKTVEKHGGEISFYRITPESLGALPTSIHITVEAYYRLLAFKLLPDNLEKVLYLDGDLLANQSLEELYQTDFSLGETEALFVACEGPGVSQKEFTVYDNLNIPKDRLYCNSGVLLMNLAAMRKELNANTFWDYIAGHQTVLKYHDQDTINGLFYDRIKYVDWHKWNQTILHIRDEKEEKERLKTSAIIHYAGSDKPWKYDYASYFMPLFWKYAMQSQGLKGLLRYGTVLFRRTLWHLKNTIC